MKIVLSFNSLIYVLTYFIYQILYENENFDTETYRLLIKRHNTNSVSKPVLVAIKGDETAQITFQQHFFHDFFNIVSTIHDSVNNIKGYIYT